MAGIRIIVFGCFDRAYSRAMRHLVLGIALAACASNSGQGPTTNTPTASGDETSSNLVCREETPTGSSISRRVCRTPEQMEDDRRAAEEMLRNPALRPARLTR
jgi:hypothetical protein